MDEVTKKTKLRATVIPVLYPNSMDVGTCYPRYFTKGTTFKHKLSYCNYIGFADQL